MKRHCDWNIPLFVFTHCSGWLHVDDWLASLSTCNTDLYGLAGSWQAKADTTVSVASCDLLLDVTATVCCAQVYRAALGCYRLAT